MSYTADQILSFALNFERNTSESLVKIAKKKEEKKSKKPGKKEDKSSSDKNKADAKEKDSKKKKAPAKKNAFVSKFDSVIFKFSQKLQDSGESGVVQNNYREQTDEDAKAFMQPGGENKTQGTGYRPDVAMAQRKLNDMISRGTLQGKLLDPDGKLGPLTKALLTAYKAYIKVPSLSDQQTITALNTKKDEAVGGPTVQDQYNAGTLQTTTPATPAPAPGGVYDPKLGF